MSEQVDKLSIAIESLAKETKRSNDLQESVVSDIRKVLPFIGETYAEHAERLRAIERRLQGNALERSETTQIETTPPPARTLKQHSVCKGKGCEECGGTGLVEG